MHEPPQHLLVHLPEACASTTDVQLIRWGRQFTPLVDVLRDGHIAAMHLDCTGCAHLFGDEYAMARRVLDALQNDFDLSPGTRAVLACTAAAARLVLAAGRACDFEDGLACIEAHELSAAIDTLPIDALVCDPAVRERLHEVGFDNVSGTFAAAAKVPGTFISRYGPDLVRQIRRVLGEHLEAPPPDRPPPPPCQVTRVFDGPLRCTQTIALAVDGLLEQLMHILRDMLHGVETLQVRLERPRRDDLVHTVRFTSPTRDLKHVRSVLAPKLERMDPGEDGAESVRVIAVQHVRMGHRQSVVWGESVSAQLQPQASTALAALIDVLQQRCTVSRRFAGAGHLPEPTPSPTGLVSDHADRPSRLFDHAPRIDVRLPDAGTGELVWKRRRFVLIDARGPEHIVEPWWTHRDNAWCTRAYWRVQRADGQWLWIYRRSTFDARLSSPDARLSTIDSRRSSPWFLHGAWT